MKSENSSLGTLVTSGHMSLLSKKFWAGCVLVDAETILIVTS